MTTYLSANETAAKFGIPVNALDKILNRKDCVKNIVDDTGRFNVEAVAAMLNKMKQAAERTRQWAAKKAAQKTTTKATKKTMKKAAKSVQKKKVYRRRRVKQVVHELPADPSALQEKVPGKAWSTFSESKRKFWEQNARWERVIDGTLTVQDALQLVNAALEFSYTELTGEKVI